MSSLNGIDNPEPRVENHSAEGDEATTNVVDAVVEQRLAQLGLGQGQEEGTLPEATTITAAAAGWGGAEETSLTEPVEAGNVDHAANNNTSDGGSGTVDTSSNDNGGTNSESHQANATGSNVTHSGGHGLEVTHEPPFFLNTGSDRRLHSASQENAAPFDPHREHLRRVHPDPHGEEVATNAPTRFELFILGPGEKKVTEEPDTRVANTSIFTFYKEDHSLGNLFKEYLHKNPHVQFAGYKVPHPLVPSFELRVQTDGAITPRQAVVQTAKGLVGNLGELSRHFTREMELFKIARQNGGQGGSGGGNGTAGGEGPSGGAGGA